MSFILILIALAIGYLTYKSTYSIVTSIIVGAAAILLLPLVFDQLASMFGAGTEEDAQS